MNLMRDEAVLHDDDVSAMDATMSACCRFFFSIVALVARV